MKNNYVLSHLWLAQSLTETKLLAWCLVCLLQITIIKQTSVTEEELILFFWVFFLSFKIFGMTMKRLEICSINCLGQAPGSFILRTITVLTDHLCWFLHRTPDPIYKTDYWNLAVYSDVYILLVIAFNLKNSTIKTLE